VAMTYFHSKEGHSQSIRYAYGLGPTQSIRFAHAASCCQALIRKPRSLIRSGLFFALEYSPGVAAFPD
jgi:hypothetical protein